MTPRYQLLMGPWQHVTTGTGVNMSALELEWFDTWLLGEHTPMATTTTPLHLDIQNSGGSWVDAAQMAPARRHAHRVLLRGRAQRQRPLVAQRRGPDDAATDGRSDGDGGADTITYDGGVEPVRHPDGPVGCRRCWRSGSSRSTPTTPATSTT